MITSVSNQTVKDLVKLNSSKYRKETQTFLVEGPHLVEEAKEAGVLLKAYTIDETLDGELVTDNVMKKITNTDTLVTQIGICKMELRNEIGKQILVLDQIQDPGNMGALMRSAKAFGFNTIFVGNGSVDIYNDKVIRASQGAIFKLNFLFGNVKEFILNHPEIVFYNTNVVNGVEVEKIVKKTQTALILGNEGNGVSEEVNSLGLTNVYLKLNNMESLNVSAAGAILMYEINKYNE